MYSAAILIAAAAILCFAWYMFAHSRLLAADLTELERLHQEGLLPLTNTLEQDFRTVTALLRAIGPAVYQHQPLWVSAYFGCLRAARWVAIGSSAIESEMRRAVAFQSGHYRLACAKLAEFGVE